MNPLKICILGDGAWGTAVAQLLAYNNYSVTLWCNDKKVAESIKNKNENTKYLPKVKLSSLIEPITDLNLAIENSSYIFEAIPVKFLRKVLKKIDLNKLNKNIPWVILSKGIEENTNLLPSQIVKDVLDQVPIAVISGPSFAVELVQKQPTGVNIASKNKNLAEQIQFIINNSFFKTIYTHDIIGVQAGGALKNVITIAIGLLESLGYKENTKSLAITQGLKEIALIVEKMGGNKDTIYGLSGLGDLVLTALGSNSKNLKFGKLLGATKSEKEISMALPTLPEGVNTAKSIFELSQNYKLDLPLCNSVYEIIFSNKCPSIIIKKLFNASSI